MENLKEQNPLDNAIDFRKEIEKKFAEWRKSKSHKNSKIPNELWLDALNLAAQTSIREVSKLLKLDVKELKKKFIAFYGAEHKALPKPRKTLSGSCSQISEFIEILQTNNSFAFIKSPSDETINSKLYQTPLLVEIQHNNGCKMKIFSSNSEICSFIKAFISL